MRARALSAALLCGACGGDAADTAEEVVVRDSAGVTIVENPAPDAARATWRVDSVPSLDIGMLEGPPEYQLESVRTARRLSDGTIVVADGGAQAIRFYDASGAHIRSVGREGSGPGEFRFLGDLMIGPGDTIRAWDYRERRVSIFGPDGAFVGTYTLDQPPGVEFTVQPRAALGASLISAPSRPFGGGQATGVVRDTSRLYVHSPTGEVVDSLGPWPHNESFVMSDGNSATVTSRAFGRSLSIATHGDRVIVGNSDRWQIEVHDATGLLLLIRAPMAARPVNAAVIDSMRRSRLEGIEEQWRRTTERLLDAMPYPETMPAFGSFHADDSGHLWVRDYTPDFVEGPVGWTILDPEGRLLARMTTPVGLRITQIGRDWMLGVWHDEFDVPHVRVHRLIRSP